MKLDTDRTRTIHLVICFVLLSNTILVSQDIYKVTKQLYVGKCKYDEMCEPVCCYSECNYLITPRHLLKLRPRCINSYKLFRISEANKFFCINIPKDSIGFWSFTTKPVYPKSIFVGATMAFDIFFDEQEDRSDFNLFGHLSYNKPLIYFSDEYRFAIGARAGPAYYFEQESLRFKTETLLSLYQVKNPTLQIAAAIGFNNLSFDERYYGVSLTYMFYGGKIQSN